ncbi:DUF4405 domain-containing protein [Anaerovorax odorimutans]|uniref:DUF4405 domain-containing protein n=1 Tax=Anaerovorax odorimutans TaxID=109327 RepID=A0ABT1RMW2_9FIRM|nr:DUF4405 domain-containing protein [Anaerovorax odorimutans]MCQ4636512.1 DUF4405 domain-containing protein [Anaerovorax odorimutans]
MRAKQKVKIAVDLAMTALLPCLMGYALLGETIHEWLGASMFCLWIGHLILNRSWIKGLAKGLYPAVRIAGTAVNGLLGLVMISMAVSGIILSKHVFAFLPITGGAAFARTLHMLGSYWGFVLMSLHLGLHWNLVLAAMRKVFPASEQSLLRITCLRAAAILISIYGIFAFAGRQLGSYLFLQNQFVFFDFSEPLAVFLADYLAIMVFIACVGYYGGKLLQAAFHRRIVAAEGKTC